MKKLNLFKLLSIFLVMTIVPIFLGLYTFKEIVIPYTNEISPKAAMPDIAYNSIEDAYRKAKPLDLELKVVERRPHPIFPKDIILEQNPLPNMAIKKGGEVRVVISAGFTSVIMPNFKGKTQDALKEYLRINSITLSSIVYTFSKAIPAYQVDCTIPASGERLFPGDGVVAMVSLGAFPDIKVPEAAPFSGTDMKKPYLNYITVLQKLKLNPFPMQIRPEFTDKPDDAEPGSVVGQNPLPGISFLSQAGKSDYPLITLTIKADKEYQSDIIKIISKYSFSPDKAKDYDTKERKPSRSDPIVIPKTGKTKDKAVKKKGK